MLSSIFKMPWTWVRTPNGREWSRIGPRPKLRQEGSFSDGAVLERKRQIDSLTLLTSTKKPMGKGQGELR